MLSHTMLRISLLIVLLIISGPHAAWANHKVFVANNAVDSDTCGTRHEPCRSISRAIDKANEGDTIVVGPGRYGDLNVDGDFDNPGEESAEVSFGCRCMILVDKRLTLLSETGAGETILDAGGFTIDVVNLVSGRVAFGKRHRDFTLIGARMEGDDDGIGLDVSAGHGVHVIDSKALDNQDAGFSFSGERHTVRYN